MKKHLSRVPKEVREQVMWVFGRREFQAERIAKVLRLECTQPTVEQQREQHGWRARVKGPMGKTKNLIRQGLVGH